MQNMERAGVLFIFVETLRQYFHGPDRAEAALSSPSEIFRRDSPSATRQVL